MALLKGRKTHEGHLVTQTILVDSASQASAKRRSDRPSAGRRRRTRARLSACGRFRAHRAADPACRSDLSRHVGRGGPPPPVPHRRRRRRGALSQARIYDPRLSRLSRVRTRPAKSPNIPISARFSALAQAKSASRRRPGLRASAAGTLKRLTPRCSRSPWRRRRRPGAERSRRGSATPACSTPCWRR